MITTMITTMTITMIVTMIVMTTCWQMGKVHAPPWLSKLYEAPASQQARQTPIQYSTSYWFAVHCSALATQTHCTVLFELHWALLHYFEVSALYLQLVVASVSYSDRRAVTHCIIYLLLQNAGTILYYPVLILYHVEQFNCSMCTQFHSFLLCCSRGALHCLLWIYVKCNCISLHRVVVQVVDIAVHCDLYCSVIVIYCTVA